MFGRNQSAMELTLVLPWIYQGFNVCTLLCLGFSARITGSKQHDLPGKEPFTNHVDLMKRVIYNSFVEKNKEAIQLWQGSSLHKWNTSTCFAKESYSIDLARPQSDVKN